MKRERVKRSKRFKRFKSRKNFGKGWDALKSKKNLNYSEVSNAINQLCNICSLQTRKDKNSNCVYDDLDNLLFLIGRLEKDPRYNDLKTRVCRCGFQSDSNDRDQDKINNRLNTFCNR